MIWTIKVQLKFYLMQFLVCNIICMTERWDLMAYIFPWASWSVALNPLANAIIYYIFIRRYRARVRRLMCCWRQPKQQVKHELLQVKQNPLKTTGKIMSVKDPEGMCIICKLEAVWKVPLISPIFLDSPKFTNKKMTVKCAKTATF